MPKIKSSIYSWGDPSNVILYGDDSVTSANSVVYAEYIDAGWYVDTLSLGQVSLAANPGAGTIPWIPACDIHVTATANSRRLSNVIGYLASLPQGGWLWDPSTSTVFAEFGPGIGEIREENGFVTSIIIDQAAASSIENLHLQVFPRRSGIVKFISVPFDGKRITIRGSAKTPGSDPLGYVKSNDTVFFEPNSSELFPGVVYDDLIVPYAYTFPLGNYYKWITEKNTFYGSGLEPSLLQFASPYRNIQTFIDEGRSRDFSPYGGGWYPSITWGCEGFPDGAYDLFNSTKETLYKPIAKVLIYDQNENPVVDSGGSLYIVLNTWFDGSCFVYTTSTNDIFNFSNSPNPQLNGYPIRVVVLDSEDKESYSFNCVVVQYQTGIIGRSSIEFSANYSVDPNLIYDYTSYQLTSISSERIANLYPGLMLASSPDLTGDYQFTTRIEEVHDDYIVISNPVAGPGSDDFVAYVPLNLPINLQSVNPKVWSQTRQQESMKLQYADSMNGAFTWEDTTISIREKKIPAGTSVLFSSDASDIAGKTTYLWNLYAAGKKVCAITNKDFLWTFLEEGLYDLDLKITDTNGNTQFKKFSNFIEVYIAEHEMG